MQKKKRPTAKPKAVPKTLVEHLKVMAKAQVVNRAPVKFHIVAGKPARAAARSSQEIS